jgi:hypothetical protein
MMLEARRRFRHFRLATRANKNSHHSKILPSFSPLQPKSRRKMFLLHFTSSERPPIMPPRVFASSSFASKSNGNGVTIRSKKGKEKKDKKKTTRKRVQKRYSIKWYSTQNGTSKKQEAKLNEKEGRGVRRHARGSQAKQGTRKED